jgi:hypothetical protein
MQDGLTALLDEYWIVEGPEQILLDFPYGGFAEFDRCDNIS